jgi:hypothetical protein
MVVGPVFVTALPESTPKLAAVPRGGRVASGLALAKAGAASRSIMAPSNTMGKRRRAACTGLPQLLDTLSFFNLLTSSSFGTDYVPA